MYRFFFGHVSTPATSQKLKIGSTEIVDYSYLGLSQVVIQKNTEPSTDVEYTLATGSGSNPYAGLDEFGRIVDLKWKQSSDLVQLKYGYDRASNRTYRLDEVATTNSKHLITSVLMRTLNWQSLVW